MVNSVGNVLALIGIVTFLNLSCMIEEVNPSLTTGSSGEDSLTKEHFLRNVADPNDERVNYTLYNIALASRDYLVRNEGKAMMAIAFGSAVNDEILLYDLFSENPTFESEFKQNLATILGRNILDFDYSNYIDSGLTYDMVYVPKIHIPNLDTLQDNRTPIIAIGAQIDESIFSLREDHILKWTESGGQFVLGSGNIDELSIKIEPVLIFVNGVVNTGVTNIILHHVAQGIPGGPPDYYAGDFRINHSYEGSGKIELRIEVASAANLWGSYIVRKLDNTEVGQNIPYYHRIWNWDVNQNADNTTIATFEYDSYAGTKTVGWVRNLGGNLVNCLSGRMKYASEWYHFHPGREGDCDDGTGWGNGNPIIGWNFAGILPNNNDIATVSTSKGYIKIHRNDP